MTRFAYLFTIAAGTLALAPIAESRARLAPVAPAIGASIPAPNQQPTNGKEANPRLTVTVGKSLIIDSPLNIQRISVANGELVEAVAVNPKEVLINGKAPGETTLVVWQQGGNRLLYDLTVRPSQAKVEAARNQLARELPDQDVTLTYENDNAFLRGSVKDVTAAERAVAIATTLGKVVNLLRVNVPPPETQILLRVRFANVDRSAGVDLGANLASTAFNQGTTTSTGQFGNTRLDIQPQGTTFTFSDALNVFLFRRDINLLATIKALQAKSLLEMLAEPNVLAINGKQASFLSGGEFPFPQVQGGAGFQAVTVSFREFGVRINFLPVITPRGTIRLQVSPEVSSLDFANGLTISGFRVPALATRRIQTEVELESGQSFVIAGLLDNRMTESLSKIPGVGDIPLLGKLFQSKSSTRNNSELLVMVTPEVVRPVAAGQDTPNLNYPKDFLAPNTKAYPRQPGMDKTGPVAVKPPTETMPVEELMQQQKQGQAAPPANNQFQFVPMMPFPINNAPANPGLAPPPMSTPGGSGK